MHFFLSKQYLVKKFSELALFTFLSWCYLLLSPLALASKNDYSSQENDVKMSMRVVTEIYPPYQFLDQSRNLQGCSVNVIKALFKQAGDKLKIEIMPWARAYVTAKNNKNTLIFSIVRTKIREPHFYWIGKIQHIKNYFWGLKSKYNKVKLTFDEIKNSPIAITNYSTDDETLTQTFNALKLDRVTNLNQGIKMLLRNRVDFVLDSKISIRNRFKAMKLDISKIISVYNLPALNYDLNIAMNIHSDIKLVKQYKSAFNILVQKGIVKKIMGRCDK